jgi:hypothetical protein
VLLAADEPTETNLYPKIIFGKVLATLSCLKPVEKFWVGETPCPFPTLPAPLIMMTDNT